MALNDAQQIKLAQILNVPLSVMQEHIGYLVTLNHISADVQTAIEAEITRWDAGASTNFTAIEPKERNFGARINPGDARASIRKNIAVLLERPDWANQGSRIVRC